MKIDVRRRESIIHKLQNKELKQSEAAHVLGLSVRQVRRLCQLYHQAGKKGLVSRHKGRIAVNRIADDIRKKVVELARTKYIDFGPTFMSEKLLELDGIQLSKESIRKILIDEKLWRAKKEKKRSIHQRRERRGCFGELIQIDGSPHAWFEDRAPACCLIVFIDDATSQLIYLQFEPVETTAAYFRGMHAHINTYGAPCAYYSDKHMIFRVSNAKTIETKPTQFERACKTLGIEGICADSPQAKGRVERVNKTLQDRLVKELRLLNISDIVKANEFLKSYIPLHNKKFAVVPRKPEDAHRTYSDIDETLQQTLSIQSIRKLSKNLELSFNNTIYQVLNEGHGRRLQQSHIVVCEMLNGEICLLAQNKSLVYKTIVARTKVTVGDKALNTHLNQSISEKLPYKPAHGHPWRKDFKKHFASQQASR